MYYYYYVLPTYSMMLGEKLSKINKMYVPRYFFTFQCENCTYYTRCEKTKK